MAGTYFTDKSGLGKWYVPEGKTPAQALADLNVTAHVQENPLLDTKPDYSGYITVIPPIDEPPPGGPIDVPPVPGGPPSGGTGGIVPFQNQEDIVRFWNEHPEASLADYVKLGAIRILGSLQAVIDFVHKLISTKTAGSGGGTQTPTTQTAINVSVNVGDSLASVIGDAIGGAATSATQLIKGMIGDITGSIKDLTGGISGWVTDVFNALKGHFKDIADWVAGHAQSIIDWLVTNVGKVIKDLAKDLSSIVTTVAGVVDKLATTIQDFNDKFIQPISSAVNGIITTISTLTTAIERDLQNGLSGILQIPSDIAGAMGTLDATLQRTVEQLGKTNKQAQIDVILSTGNEKIGTHLESVAKVLDDLRKKDKVQTTFEDFTKLVDACDLAELRKEITKFTSKEVSFTGVIKEVLDVIFYVMSIYEAAYGVFEVTKECGLENARKIYPITKLGPGLTIEALRRGFIDEKTALDELTALGFNQQRFRVMRDLDLRLLDTATLLDLRFRGIITYDDWKKGLQDLGYTFTQVQAFDDAKFKLVSPGVAITLYRYGQLTKDEVSNVLAINHYSPEEIELTLAAEFRPATGLEALNGVRNRRLLSQLNIADDWADDVLIHIITQVRANPQIEDEKGREDIYEFVRGRISEGLDNRAILYTWYASRDTLPTPLWLELYFRGHRTKTELEHVLTARGIPGFLHDDYIDSHRGLIPWRTIPRMLALGVISEPYAKAQLGGHGFDLTAIEAMLKLARSAQSKALSASSGELHAISVNNARQAFELGTLTEQQYHDVLLAHGYDEASAKLAINVETLQAHIHERRQLGVDLTNEVLGGLISIDDAMTQMRNHNFSVAESARVLKSIARTQKATVKTPPEPELRQLVKHKIITLDEYQNALGLLGYAPKWVDAFVQWHFGGSDESTAAAQPA